MGDETKPIKFKVTADGTKEATDGLSKVAEQLERQKTAVKAMDDAVAQSGYLARLASYRAEAAALNAEHDKNAATMKALSKEVDGNTKAFGAHSNELRSKLGASAELVSRLSGSFTQIVPAAAQFQGAIDVSLRSLSSFLGVLGGGPGMLLGGAVAAIGLLGTVMSSSAKDAEQLAKGTDDASSSFQEYLAKIAAQRSGGFKGVQSAEQQKRDALIGKAPVEEYDTELAALNQKLADNLADIGKLSTNTKLSYRELQHNATIVIPTLQSANEQIRDQILLLKDRRQEAVENFELDKQAAASQKEFARTIAEYGTKGSKVKQRNIDFSQADSWVDNTDKNAAKRDEYQRRAAEARAAIDAIDKMQFEYREKQRLDEEESRKAGFARELAEREEQVKRLLDQYRQTEFDKTALLTTNLAEQRAALESQIGETVTGLHAQDAEEMLAAEELKRQAMQETHEEFMQLQEEQAGIIQQNLQAERATRAQVNQSMMALGTTLAQMTAKQLSEAVKGHKIQAAMIIEGLGDAMVAEGVRVMFQGATMMLLGNYASGGGLLAVGAAELAAGLALGAAGSAMQPPSSGAGDANNAPGASPVRDTQSSNGASERGPTVIYIQMDTVISPSAEDGMRIRQAVDAASRVYGAPV